jgi:hypothetical protein
MSIFMLTAIFKKSRAPTSLARFRNQPRDRWIQIERLRR